MAVPVASCIRRSYPNAFIAWAIGSRSSDVVDTSRLVDLKYHVPREDWKSKHVSWWHQLRHMARLRAFRFDYGLDLQGHSKTAICLRIANPTKRIASRATDIVAQVVNPISPGVKKRQHWVERNLEVLRSLGDFPGDSSPIMPELDAYVPRLQQDCPDLSNLITISVGAGHPTKRYPPQRWADVAKIFMREGFTVGLLGGRGEIIDVPWTINWIDQLTLAESMAAVVNSKIHLASDTGTGHIAAAYGVPVVSVFGYTDPVRYRPYTTNAIVLDAGRQMNAVSPEQIVDAAKSLLKQQVYAVSS